MAEDVEFIDYQLYILW